MPTLVRTFAANFATLRVAASIGFTVPIQSVDAATQSNPKAPPLTRGRLYQTPAKATPAPANARIRNIINRGVKRVMPLTRITAYDWSLDAIRQLSRFNAPRPLPRMKMTKIPTNNVIALPATAASRTRAANHLEPSYAPSL